MATTAFYAPSEMRQDLKRKRIFNETDDVDSEDDRQPKKSHPRQLPLRLSPTQRHSFGPFGLAVAHPLTPGDDSEDEGRAQNGQHVLWSHHHRSLLRNIDDLNNSNPNLMRRDSNLDDRIGLTINIDPSTDQDTDTEMSMDSNPTSHPPRPTPKGRARSNDLICPPKRIPDLLHAPSISMEESHHRTRIPTPTAAAFALTTTPNSNNNNITQFNRNPSPYAKSWQVRRRPMGTALSPLMNEEYGLPSPVEPMDTESVMAMDHASDGFNALSVNCRDERNRLHGYNRNNQRQHERDMFISSSPLSYNQIQIEYDQAMQTSDTGLMQEESCGRTAKLHMGFRADCEKCVQRVPGHYSHIIWT